MKTITINLLILFILFSSCGSEDLNKNQFFYSDEQSIDQIEGFYENVKKNIANEDVKTELLYDYLLDQQEIIDSLISGIKADELSPGNLFSFEITLQKEECIQLIESLNEELRLILFNRSLKDKEVNLINVQDYGAIGDGVHDDRHAIITAIEVAKKSDIPSKIIFPKGIYAIEGNPARDDRVNLPITDIENCIFEGDSVSGSTLLMKTYRAGLSIRRCNNLLFRNIKIDYDPLPFTQGVIRKIDRENDLVEIEIERGYPRPEDERFKKAKYLRGTMNHPETGRMIYEAGDWRVVNIEEMSNGNFRFGLLTNEGQALKGLSKSMIEGHYFVLHARETPGGGSAIVINGSSFITFHRVSVYASPHDIASLMYADAIKFIEFEGVPKPGTNRLTCSNADGFHCRSNRKGPYIFNSRLFRINDDDTNIFGKMFPVAKQVSETEYIINDRGFELVNGKVYSAVYRPGDLVGFVNLNDGFSIDNFRRIKTVDTESWKGRDWIMITLDEPVNGIITRDSLGKDPYVSREYVNVQQPYTEHFLANLDTKGNGFIIKNNSFGDHRASSIKIQSTNGLIENNNIHSVKGQAFFFGALMNWLELYPPRNIIVRNNTVDNSKGFGVTIASPTTTEPVNIVPMRRIYILNNHFYNASQHGINLSYIKDAYIMNNYIESDNPLITSGSCENIIESGNRFVSK